MDISNTTLRQTPLYNAIISNSLDNVRSLVVNGANVNEYNTNGWTPLYTAATFGNLDMVNFLLEQEGIDPNRQNDDTNREAPLHAASLLNGSKVIQVLIDAGANVNQVDNNGWTPLHNAAANGRIDNIQVLLSNGANAILTNNEGIIAAEVAFNRGYSGTRDYLLNYMFENNLITDEVRINIEDRIRSDWQEIENFRNFQTRIINEYLNITQQPQTNNTQLQRLNILQNNQQNDNENNRARNNHAHILSRSQNNNRNNGRIL